MLTTAGRHLGHEIAEALDRQPVLRERRHGWPSRAKPSSESRRSPALARRRPHRDRPSAGPLSTAHAWISSSRPGHVESDGDPAHRSAVAPPLFILSRPRTTRHSAIIVDASAEARPDRHWQPRRWPSPPDEPDQQDTQRPQRPSPPRRSGPPSSMAARAAACFMPSGKSAQRTPSTHEYQGQRSAEIAHAASAAPDRGLRPGRRVPPRRPVLPGSPLPPGRRGPDRAPAPAATGRPLKKRKNSLSGDSTKLVLPSASASR